MYNIQFVFVAMLRDILLCNICHNLMSNYSFNVMYAKINTTYWMDEIINFISYKVSWAVRDLLCETNYILL
jgi:hypothetical protein